MKKLFQVGNNQTAAGPQILMITYAIDCLDPPPSPGTTTNSINAGSARWSARNCKPAKEVGDGRLGGGCDDIEGDPSRSKNAEPLVPDARVPFAVHTTKHRLSTIQYRVRKYAAERSELGV